MNVRYRVTLTQYERNELRAILNGGKSPARKLKRAQILLAANAGRLLTRDEILDQLWGSDYVAESNVVDRHIRNMRVKLQNNSTRPRYIATGPGRGYRFVLRTADVPPAAPGL